MLVKMCCTLLYIDIPFFPLAKHENLACPLALNEVCGENEDSLIFAFNKSVRKQCPCPNVRGCYVLTKQNPGWHQVSSRCTVHLCTFVFRSSSSTSWRLRQNHIFPNSKAKIFEMKQKNQRFRWVPNSQLPTPKPKIQTKSATKYYTNIRMKAKPIITNQNLKT